MLSSTKSVGLFKVKSEERQILNCDIFQPEIGNNVKRMYKIDEMCFI